MRAVHLALSAVGLDRPGIVAAVSRVLFERGANLEDSRMALLGGQFAMMLIVSVSDDADVDALENGLADATGNMDLVITLRRVEETSTHPAGTPYVVTVYTADRPGIVAGVTAALAEHGANIVDLATHVAEGGVYIMVIEVTLPPTAEPERVEAALRGAAGGVDVSFRPIEAGTL